MSENVGAVEARLRFVAKAQIALGVFVVGGMFIVIALLSFALLRANAALDETKRLALETTRLSQDNCFNIEVNRAYYDSLDRSLTSVIRKAPPGADLTILRQLVDQARLARNSMLVVNCQEAQG